jgi:SHS2 domain-containing protein
MKGMKEDAEYDEDEELLEAKEDEEEDEEEEEEKGSKKNKKEGKKNSFKDDEEDMEESFQIEDDVNALLSGEELSEGFKEKAKIIFEAALKSKITEIKETVESQYEQKLIEEVEVIKEALSDRVDSYLEYVSEEWFVENELAIEHGLKTDLTESFLSGMKGLFEEHYVTIPEDRYDVLESMVEKLDDMETKLNEQIEKNISLNKRLAESVADGILDQVSDGLAATQKEKLASLSESVEFESEDEYREKVEMLRESYFPANKTPKAHAETLSEGVDHSPESISGTMAGYLRTLEAVAKI